jgi:hypothetical protein
LVLLGSKPPGWCRSRPDNRVVPYSNQRNGNRF